MKSLYLSILFLTSIYFVGTSQVNHVDDTLHSHDTVFFNNLDPNVRIVDQIMPEFPGGPDSLIAFAKKNLKYPKNLIKSNIEGRVTITFTVDQKGVAGDVGFLNTLHPEIEKECVEMINKLPKFKPAEGITK